MTKRLRKIIGTYIGRDQISPQKKGGKADPVVKRRVSAGSEP
jgi:hypothetical protein